MFDSMIQQVRGVAVAGLSRAELEGLVAGAGRVVAAMGALQARCATEIEALDDGGVSSKTVLREAGRMSTRAANKVARTAAGLVEMPKLAESLAQGKITTEHAEVAVSAAVKTSPQQVNDQLAGLAEESSVDAFVEQSRRWVNRNQPDNGTGRYERQRRDRSLKHWVDDEGMGILFAKLDPVSYQQVRKAIDVEYDRLWRGDGGRDGSPDDVRTVPQRMADAFVALLTNPARRKPGSTRHQLIAIADIERLRGDDPTGVAEIVGGEALPQTVLERLICTAAVTGIVFDGKGQPLWVGRTH
ncbi:MAG: 13E12 repeat family protein, partial [Acidimicrobiia bacterium]|nr:13E12 repeat family protein [Acidimicrobiia bacterium]